MSENMVGTNKANCELRLTFANKLSCIYGQYCVVAKCL